MFTDGLFPRILSILLGAAVAMNTTGCATVPPPPSPETRRELGTIGIVALSSTPRVEFQTFAKGWAVGASKGGAYGMLDGFLYGLGESIRNPTSGPFAGAVILIGAVVMTTVNTLVYGVAGGLEAVPGKTAEQIEKDLNSALGDASLAGVLAERIHAVAASRQDLDRYTVTHLGSHPSGTGTSWRDSSGRGIDTVVEVRVTEAGFRGGRGAHPDVSFYLNARIRLVDTETGGQIFTRDFQYFSSEGPFAEWFSDSSRNLLAAFGQAMETLAERILDELFLVTDFPFEAQALDAWKLEEFGPCWFHPIYPELEYTSLWDSIRHNAPGIRIRHTPVASLQPLLFWESFPRPRDLKESNAAVLSKISDVTYDLKIWEAPEDYPERLVYEIQGLSLPKFRPPFDLKPQTKYFWTFRVRYNMEGQPQLTRWAFSAIPWYLAKVESDQFAPIPLAFTPFGMVDWHAERPHGGMCNLDNIPARNYFRFITP